MDFIVQLYIRPPTKTRNTKFSLKIWKGKKILPVNKGA